MDPGALAYKCRLSLHAEVARSHRFPPSIHQNFYSFYGHNLFKAESSSTCGGLDSLLEPHGALRDAQDLAARSDQFQPSGAREGSTFVYEAP